MEKIILRIFWVFFIPLFILSASAILSTEDDKSSVRKYKILSRTEGWEDGKKIWEKITYIPEIPKAPIQPSGMGTWEGRIMDPNLQDSSSTYNLYGQHDGW